MLTELLVTVPPIVEPLTIDDLKAHLHIMGSAEDSYLSLLIPQCRDELEHIMRTTFLTQTLQATFTLPELTQTTIAGFIGNAQNYFIELVHPPVQSISTVELEYIPGQFHTLNFTLDPAQTSDYFIQPGSPPKLWLFASAFNNILYPLEPNYIAVQGFPSVRVTYVAGYTTLTLPKRLVALLMQLAAYRFYNREDMSFPSTLMDGAQGGRTWHL